jgi:alpha-glucuronidase
MKEMKEAVKNMENHLAKIMLILNSMQDRILLFLITFIRWQKRQKNGKTVLSYMYTRKVVNKRWREREKLAYLMPVINHTVKFFK